MLEGEVKGKEMDNNSVTVEGINRIKRPSGVVLWYQGDQPKKGKNQTGKRAIQSKAPRRDARRKSRKRKKENVRCRINEK